jgi:hypothetical protein
MTSLVGTGLQLETLQRQITKFKQAKLASTRRLSTGADGSVPQTVHENEIQLDEFVGIIKVIGKATWTDVRSSGFDTIFPFAECRWDSVRTMLLLGLKPCRACDVISVVAELMVGVAGFEAMPCILLSISTFYSYTA